MDKIFAAQRTLDDYPLSLQNAARALWGDDFWGRYKPKPVPASVAPKTRRL